MWLRRLTYRCDVCQWRGQLEPIDFGDTAPCPQCGVYLHPLSWFQTWGITLLILAGCVAGVAATALWLR